MRILHTSDWHMNDRLGHRNRQSDIVARFEEIATYLEEHRVDVMAVSGDLFSTYTRMEELRDAIGDVNSIFKPFLLRGGTIVAISGNHDNEALFNLLRFTLDLAYPIDPGSHGPRPRGRLYLAAQPTYLLLEDAAGEQVQFVLMPYPTAARYLRDDNTRYNSHDERNRLLHEALRKKLDQFKERTIDPRLPSAMFAHIHVRGSEVHNLYHISEREDVIFEPGEIPTNWAYVGYGHIHKPQNIDGVEHVRYAGSIERFDYGERDDEKSVVLIDIGPKGRRGEPTCLPLDATPIYHIEITDPEAQLPTLRNLYPQGDRALVSYKLIYKPGEHNRDAIRQEIESMFPRWCRSEIVPDVARMSSEMVHATTRLRDVPGTVRTYLQNNIAADNPYRDDLLALVEELLVESEVH
jgi:exonuclease SbcD